jgi:hypothetical protein
MKNDKTVECEVCGVEHWQVDLDYSEVKGYYYCPTCYEEIDYNNTVKK